MAHPTTRREKASSTTARQRKPAPGRHIGEVGDPELVGLLGVEVAIDQVAGRPDPLVPDRRARPLAAADAGQTVRLHQPLYALAADMDALGRQLRMDARRAIGPFRRRMDPTDLRRQLLVGKVARRWLTSQPRVEAAARHAHGARQGLDGEIGLVRGHELEDLDDVASL
jgi:hypothetical protein